MGVGEGLGFVMGLVMEGMMGALLHSHGSGRFCFVGCDSVTTFM